MEMVKENHAPFFCVSAAILGRLIHTFKEEHITQDLERRASEELVVYVDEMCSSQKIACLKMRQQFG